MNSMQKKCYFYSFFLDKKGGVSDTGKNTYKEKSGVWKKQYEIFSIPAPARLSCLCSSDAGHCWSFLREFPAIAKILAEEKFQQNQS